MNCFERSTDWSGEWEISCPNCSLSLTTYYLLPIAKPKEIDNKKYNHELAITRWNRRA